MSESLKSPGTMTTGIGNEPVTCAIMVISGPGPSGPGLAASTSIEISTSLSITSRIWGVGAPQPLLVLVLDFDDAQHHHPAAAADCPAAGVVHRAVPFRGLVHDDKAF